MRKPKGHKSSTAFHGISQTTKGSYKTPSHPLPFFLGSAKERRALPSFFLISSTANEEVSARVLSLSAMEMRKIACAVLIAAASATTTLAAEAPAPGPASASFAINPAAGAVIGASLLSFFAFYLQ
ncbi:hypothetical protein OPV22_026469 [Ensete ventricosum]|uniref:Arabinogalactan peptide 23-like n=1 Tax=Ensete ventricosum TaxID=4639 RepID=A0AAV8P8J1_ENSVE|nr:hypothetical protein OPV22_026469 [Ensete ventricosum]